MVLFSNAAYFITADVAHGQTLMVKDVLFLLKTVTAKSCSKCRFQREEGRLPAEHKPAFCGYSTEWVHPKLPEGLGLVVLGQRNVDKISSVSERKFLPDRGNISCQVWTQSLESHWLAPGLRIWTQLVQGQHLLMGCWAPAFFPYLDLLTLDELQYFGVYIILFWGLNQKDKLSAHDRLPPLPAAKDRTATLFILTPLILAPLVNSFKPMV